MTLLESYQPILEVHLTCLDPSKAKKKFLVGGGRVVKTKKRVRLRSISDPPDLDLTWTLPGPDLDLTWTLPGPGPELDN